MSASPQALKESPKSAKPIPSVKASKEPNTNGVEEISVKPRTQSKEDLAKTKEAANQFLLGNLINDISAPFKTLKEPFSKMSEIEQSTLLTRVAEAAKKSVSKAIDAIASGDRVNFRTTCDQVQFKADGVKAQLSMFNTIEAHNLADYAGKTVMVVIEDGSRYLGTGDSTKGTPDQKPMFDKSKE